MAEFTTAIILETRQPRKKDGRCPVKLRVTIDRRARYYSIGSYFLSEKEYNLVYCEKPKKQYKKLLQTFTAIEEKAIKLLEAMEMPTFEQFKRLFTQKGTGGNVKKYFEQRIEELKKDNAFGTATTYDNALTSFEDIKGITALNFKQVNPEWLKDYHKKMIVKGRSRNTISIYTRCLRYLYNLAIKDGVISEKYYPFGKDSGKYQIPSSQNNKRPLQREEIIALVNYSGNPFHEYYRDFFMLSYYLIGLNFADLLTIKWKQIQDNTLTVARQKTAHNANEVTINLYITQKAWAIIDRYSNKDSEFVFDIASSKDPEQRKRQVRNFTRNCNQSLKKIAKIIGINERISTMFARHSAASHGLSSGATIGDISEALGHTDIRTTNNYIKSLEEAGRELAENLEKSTVPNYSVPKVKNGTIEIGVSDN